jgi:diguanylate cyclase (GGDEF)-like protein
MELIELSIEKLGKFIDGMRQVYHEVRVVDPQFCRVMDPDNGARICGHCFEVWAREHRCRECVSYRACLAKKVVEKDEICNDKCYHVIAMPFRLTLKSGVTRIVSVELISCVPVGHKTEKSEKSIEEICIEAGLQEGTGIPPYLTQTFRIVRHKKRHDPVTDLYNRDTFLSEAQQTMEKMPEIPRKFLVLKLKDMQKIKATYGTEASNEILRNVADSLKEYCGDGDIFGRIASDRFAALLLADRYDKKQFDACVTSREEHYKKTYQLRFQNSEFETDPESLVAMLDKE